MAKEIDNPLPLPGRYGARQKTRSISVLSPYVRGAWYGLLHYLSLASLGSDPDVRYRLRAALETLSERRIA